MKLKGTTANNLMILLNSIPREKLYFEGMTSVENKWKAMTLRSKISGLLKEANSDFNKKLDKAQEVLKKHSEEGKLLEAQYGEPEKETPEEKKTRLSEKQKAVDELNERAGKEIVKASGLEFVWYVDLKGVALAKFKKEEDDKEIEVKLDAKFNQAEFLKEQMNKNIYEIKVSDEVISEIAQALEI